MSLNGYFAGPNGDLSWAHKDDKDAEWNAFVEDNAKGGGVLVFGRVTYQMMASYWPTPLAAQNAPVIAERLNSLQKIVFSRSLDQASWNNTRLVKGDLPSEMHKLKQVPGDDMVILGSGSIVSQLAQARMIDEYQIVVNPNVLATGSTLFAGITDNLNVNLTKTRAFRNGCVLLSYVPAQ
jgi:dihydrofolate reductase